jgi:hypothetical protein
MLGQDDERNEISGGYRRKIVLRHELTGHIAGESQQERLGDLLGLWPLR